MTRFRGCAVAAGCARSSPRTTRRCATAGKTPAKQFTGYKLHAAADAQAPILTAISLSPGNEHDGHHAGGLIDQQAERIRPERVIGDTAYGNVEVREELEQRSIEVLAPVHSSSPKDGTIAKEKFLIDLAADTVTCPRGKTAPIYKSRPRRRVPSSDRVGRKRPVTGSPASRAATASPARCERVAPRAGGGRSGSAGARTCAKPRCRRYPTPPSATIYTAPDRESSGYSDSSSTATEGARAATSATANRCSKPSGPPSSSTSTRSEPP